MVYEINLQPLNLDRKCALLNSLFGAINLTKNADLDRHSYSGYSISFDTCRTVSLPDDSGLGKNVIICGVDKK